MSTMAGCQHSVSSGFQVVGQNRSPRSAAGDFAKIRECGRERLRIFREQLARGALSGRRLSLTRSTRTLQAHSPFVVGPVADLEGIQ